LIFNLLFAFHERRIVTPNHINTNNKNRKNLSILKKEGDKEKHAQNRNTDGAGRTTGVAKTKIKMNNPRELAPLLA